MRRLDLFTIFVLVVVQNTDTISILSDTITKYIFEETKLTISFSDSNKIVHLKDVFQNQHEIVLVLEYAPGRCLFLILVFK